jgi:predicted DsbA family dithiol-disulfide isomerase
MVPHAKAHEDRFRLDVSCPWCIMGLEEALARTGELIDAHITFQPFELNPQMGKDGEDIVEHIAEKYGSSPEQAQANRAMNRDRAADLGFTMAMSDRSRIYNTFAAHRLLHWAEAEGKQAARKHADLIAFGQAFIANPDPVERLKRDAPLNAIDKDTLYGGGAKGYSDYPNLETQNA